MLYLEIKMRYKINKRYYFEYYHIGNLVGYGYIIRHRNTQAWDQDEKGKTVLLKYRWKYYDMKPTTFKHNGKTRVHYWTHVVSDKPNFQLKDGFQMKLVDYKQFEKIYTLFGPKNEKRASSQGEEIP